MIQPNSQWFQLFQHYKLLEPLEKVIEFVQNRRSITTVFPPENLVFNAFNSTDFNQVKVVIIGQDPYHGLGQAHGLCFSVPDGISLPPSLKNIYQELELEFGVKMPESGNLQYWANQGVFLLNTLLTVEQGTPLSHAQIGWESFTKMCIQLLSKHRNNVVFLLWGSHAQKLSQFIDNQKHLVLTTVHPSPLSAYRGFMGCNHCKLANDYLIKHNLLPIDWNFQASN
jgi:uracil-DNA glycosylase